MLVVGTIFPVLGHSFGEPEIIVSATENSTGISRSICESCGEEKLDSIPKLNENNNLGNNSDNSSENNSESSSESSSEISSESSSESSSEVGTEAPNNSTEKAGCGSTVSISLIALVTAVAAGFVLSKKK